METSGCGENRDLTSKYLALYNAALSGDWETANTFFFENNREETEAVISFFNERALHVATVSGRANDFVRKLVALMRPEALALGDICWYTALHGAAKVGNTEAAMVMLQKYPDLLYVVGFGDQLPVTTAAMHSQKDILKYLISVSKPYVENTPFEGQLGIDLLIEIISSEFFDIALDLVDKYPDLARLKAANYGGRCALSFMAEMESVFLYRESFNLWEKFIYRCVPIKQQELRSKFDAGDIESQTYRRSSTSFHRFNTSARKQLKSMIWKVMEQLVPGAKGIKDKKEMHKQALELAKYLCNEMKKLPDNDVYFMIRDSMFRAAAHGISDIVQLIMEMYPALTTSVDSIGRNILHLAASNRFENVFNLTYNMSDRKHLFSNGVDFEGNNLMHICARQAPPDRLNLVPGAALQMQRELQWFNEMERFVPPSRRKCLNRDRKTPKVLFTEQHQVLKEQGEKWMKDTATACSIATALIATIVFAAAFTVPGGVSSETGIPVLSKEPAFILFSSTNAVSLFTSITSLMMFLSILTSRYAEGDFLHDLPKRLSLGLLTLFISITFMLVAFSSALYLVFNKTLLWFMIPVAAFGWWPVASFVLLQSPLIVDVVYSTYGPGIFGKKNDSFFY